MARRVREPGAPTTLASLALVPALLAATSGARLDLVDNAYVVPEWKYVEPDLQGKAGILICSFTAAPGERVRIAVLRQEQIERKDQDRPYGILAASGTGTHATLETPIAMPGRYAVVIENGADAGRPAHVHLKVSFAVSSAVASYPRYLSRARRTAVIAISLGVFFGIVVFAARRLARRA